MTETKIYNSQFGEIRTATTESGEPLFCLADLCRMLNLTNVGNVKSRLDIDDIRQMDVIDSIGRKQEVPFVTEPGMYTVILKSDSLLAKPVQKWVTSEVLPTIRKTGGYLVAHQDDSPEEIMARAVIVASDTLNRMKSQLAQKDIVIAVQQEAIEEAAPKVEYYDNVLHSDDSLPITIIAKEIGMSAKALNTKLHNAGIQYKVGKTWVLFAPHQNKGWTKTLTFDPSMTGNKARVSTYWTQEGRMMILRDFS
ncbi:MAG TPA: phage antirepressor KilAC domain-containing protein [Prolixibacteraceae bacterium]